MSNKRIIHGKHSVLSMLKHNPKSLISLYIASENLKLFNDYFIDNKIKIVKPAEFNNLLPGVKAHQNIMAICSNIQDKSFESLSLDKTHSVLLVLDQITDISNIGSILRSSAAFKADAIIMGKDNSPQDFSQITKISSGASEIVPIIKVTNFINIFKKLKDSGYWVIGLDHNTQSFINEFDIPPKIAIVLGSEGKGIRRLVAENCDILCKIPIDPQMESLNVATCASISLYEYYKNYHSAFNNQ